MKDILCIVLLFVAGTAFAQPAGVTVALAATPASTQTVNAGSVVLKATVTTPGVGVQPVGGGGTNYDRDRLRYTFKAQRTWPCPETLTLAENVHATTGGSTLIRDTHEATFSWVPAAAKAGEYTFSVEVIHISRTRSVTPTKILKPERLGSATLKYKVKPQGSTSGFTSSFNPQSPTTAPVSLLLTLYINNPPPARWYRLTYRCEGPAGCSPFTQTKDHQSPYGGTSFAMQIPNRGAYMFPIVVDQVRDSDCLWEGSTLFPHTSPAYYYVN